MARLVVSDFKKTATAVPVGQRQDGRSQATPERQLTMNRNVIIIVMTHDPINNVGMQRLNTRWIGCKETGSQRMVQCLAECYNCYKQVTCLYH